MSMASQNLEIKDEILMAALDDAAFDGWSWSLVQDATEKAGHPREMALAVFPDKLNGVLRYFSNWADTQMLDRLSDIDPDSMRIRDRIRLAVQTRLSVLKDHKEAVRYSTSHFINPLQKPVAAKMVWASADAMWKWAGDTSTDYNKYTKRTLLSGVLTSTMIAWMNDDTDDMSKTLRFLDARIENVMQFGKIMGRVKSAAPFKKNPFNRQGEA